MDMAWTPGANARTAGVADVAGLGSEFGLGSAEFLSAALNGANIGIWQYDLAKQLWTSDNTTMAMLGALPGQQDIWSGVHADDRESVMTAMATCIESRSVTGMEFRARGTGGVDRWVHVLAHPIFPPGSGGLYLAGICMDVTDRRRAEESLRESERQLRTILGNLPGIAYRCSLEAPWKMAFISDGVGSMTGHTVEEFMDGELCWEELIHPDDRQFVRDEVARAVSERSRYTLEYRILHHSGEVRWVHETGGGAYDEDGNPLFLEGFIGDIHVRKLAEEKRQLAEERNRLVSLAVTDGVWELDTQTNELTINEAFAAAFGYQQSEIGLDGRWWLEQVHPDDRERLVDEMFRVLTGGTTEYLSEHRFRRSDGSYAEVYSCCYIMRDEAGVPVSIIGALQDLTARKLADAALRESHAMSRSIVEASTDCVKMLDLTGRLQFINCNGAQMMELDDPDSVVGRRWEELLPKAARSDVRHAIKKAGRGEVGRFTALAPTSKGLPKWWDIVVSPVLLADGAVIGLVAVSRDITEGRKAEEQLVCAATRDSLTRLPNRAYFQVHLAELVSAAADGGRVALMLLDLDDFKQINDTLGHDAGDVLLETIAARLLAACDGTAFVARLGGDEFAVVYPDCGSREDLAGIAARILEELHEPIVHEGRILDCHATIGAATYPLDGETPADLLKSADLALYAAKASRRGGFVAFDPVHRSEMEERLEMIAHARTAIRERLIMPYYQPKIALDTRTVVGFEALLRWRDQDGAIHHPASIAAAFDDLDLAAAISDGMIDQVVEDMRCWLDAGIEFGHVAVNAAAAEFRRGDFAEGLLSRLHKAGVPPRKLQLEVTETVFLGRGAEYVERALRMLSEAGASIALDDFGTGYASLRHLKQFPVHVIKIDQSFVRDMSSDADDAAIIEAVLNLGRSLGMEVVAEGIESEHQESHLRALGCRFGQGFLYSEAIPSGEVPALIAAWAHRYRLNCAGLESEGLSAIQRDLARLSKTYRADLRRAG